MSVYFALATNGLVKIGFSKNPLARIKSLRGTVGQPLKLVAVIDGDEADERRMHMRFGEFYSHGEWFFYRGRLKTFIETQPAPKQPDYKPTGNEARMSKEYIRLMTLQICERYGCSEEKARQYVIDRGPPRPTSNWPPSTLNAVFGPSGAPAGRRPKQLAET